MGVREATALEHWRKRYLKQGVVVVLISVSAFAGFCVLDIYWGFKLLFFFLVVLVAYLMIKELREGLQVRGENLILEAVKNEMKDVVFDFGRGVDENTLLQQDTISAYQIRDCFNTISGARFFLEEDIFYSVISARFLSFKQTAFSGVVLAVNMPCFDTMLKGKIVLNGEKTGVVGDMAVYLKKNNADLALKKVMRLFGAQEADVVGFNDTCYVWIKSDKKIFHQFYLFRPNSVNAFLKRIENLLGALKETAEALNG